MSASERPVGKTKDAGWEIGVSRTVPARVERVWAALVSPAGLAVWLGDGAHFEGNAGEPYETADGTSGELRSFRPGDRIRLTWQPADWTHDSTVQIALRDKGEKTGMTFHQERLADSAERERQRAHWRGVADAFVDHLGGGE
ncbi:MAG: SRPBCC domain-containing protein [Microthrixaceae bacterium]|nr:SRPBCC domain-containing protein [Microthrixaceae bacterium]